MYRSANNALIFQDNVLNYVFFYLGVYKHTSGGPLGGHAIKILGWGTENNTPYW